MPRVIWVNGPLDGCVEDLQHALMVWVGPDPTDPKGSVVIYSLYSDGTYRFDQRATNEANQRLKER